MHDNVPYEDYEDPRQHYIVVIRVPVEVDLCEEYAVKSVEPRLFASSLISM